MHTLVMENFEGETIEMMQGVIDAGVMSDEGITQLHTLGTSLLGASKSRITMLIKTDFSLDKDDS